MLLFRSSSWKSEKERKIKSRLLMFSRLSAEKESTDDYHAIRKQEQEQKIKESKLLVSAGENKGQTRRTSA